MTLDDVALFGICANWMMYLTTLPLAVGPMRRTRRRIEEFATAAGLGAGRRGSYRRTQQFTSLLEVKATLPDLRRASAMDARPVLSST